MPAISQSDINTLQPGIYNSEYYDGSQVAIYMGDIWIDEITSFNFQVTHSKRPIYGYADQYFRAVSKGQILVEGSFTINFKEAGYLWLALNEYFNEQGRSVPLNDPSIKGNLNNPFLDSDDVVRQNIERIVQYNDLGDTEFIKKRNEAINTMAEFFSKSDSIDALQNTAASLGGFPGGGRVGPDSPNLGRAENFFEKFEDAIWTGDTSIDTEQGRDVANVDFNGFDLYISYGDFIGSNNLNHTIRKLSNVCITSWGQQIVSEQGNLQEQYTFIARNAV